MAVKDTVRLQPFLRSSADNFDWAGAAAHSDRRDHRARSTPPARATRRAGAPSSSCRPHRAPPKRPARGRSSRGWRAVPIAGRSTDAELQPMLEFYDEGARRAASTRHPARPRAHPGEPAVHLPRRAGSRGAGAGHALSDQRRRARVAAVVLPVEQHSRRGAADAGRAGTLQQPAVLEQQVRRMLADPTSRALVDELRRPVAAAAQRPQRAAELRPVPGLRRQPAPGVPPRDRAALRQHHPRGPQRARPADAPTTRSSTSGWRATTASRTSTAASFRRVAGDGRRAARAARAGQRSWP